MISTTYKGNKLEIGYNETALRSSVLWYGQLILQRGLGNYFDFHLQVTTGRPVNPLSPSRAGIIQDAAYNELLAFIKSEILAFVFDPQNRARIKAAHVEACYKLDASYSLANCPYIVAESIQTSENPNSLEDFNSTSDYDFNNRSINNSFNKIAQSDAPDELKEHLEKLNDAVKEMIQRLPEAQQKQAAQDLQTLTDEALSEEPRRKWYELSAEGLIEAAKAVGEIAVPVITAAKAVLAFLA